ncbi:MAG: tetratricopeptide repeat protein [Alphaproteobacteria bacterium]|nr:tetratricopeptide repeat protein [Alphaproteobacteria bacterium]
MKPYRINKTILMASCVFALGACQTTSSTSTPPQSRSSKIDNAMQRAAISAKRSGNANKSLSVLEQIYKRNSNNEQSAIDYAAALRRNDYVNRASIIMEPFATDPEASSASKTEFSAIMLAKGDYKLAERYAQQAVTRDETNPEAYHFLGVALDAQSEHEKAERAFRKALDLWDGDPTSIMNNLALNLASQGHLDEAADILQKAREVSPNREEIERNLRIITALQQSNGIPVPKPKKKPTI